MSAHGTYPRNPSEPLLAKEQLARLDKFAKQIPSFLNDLEKAVENEQKLKQKADDDAARVARVAEGYVEEEGKVVDDLDETTLGLHIQRAEAAVILSRGKHRQALANISHVGSEIYSLRVELCEKWTPNFHEIKREENEAWKAWARLYFHPRSPMYTEAGKMFFSSRVANFCDTVCSTLKTLSMSSGGTYSQQAASILSAIELMKGAPTS